MAISNEVLAERLDNWTKQSLEQQNQQRRDFTAVMESLRQVTDQVQQANDRLNLHEQQPGHPVSLTQMNHIEKDLGETKKDVAQLKTYSEVINKVTGIEREQVAARKDLNTLMEAHVRQEGVVSGRQSVLTLQEKIALLLIAAAPTLTALVQKVVN